MYTSVCKWVRVWRCCKYQWVMSPRHMCVDSGHHGGSMACGMRDSGMTHSAGMAYAKWLMAEWVAPNDHIPLQICSMPPARIVLTHLCENESRTHWCMNMHQSRHICVSESRHTCVWMRHEHPSVWICMRPGTYEFQYKCVTVYLCMTASAHIYVWTWMSHGTLMYVWVTNTSVLGSLLKCNLHYKSTRLRNTNRHALSL